MGRYRTTEEWLALVGEKSKRGGFNIVDVGFHRAGNTSLVVQRGTVVRKCTASDFMRGGATFGIGCGHGGKRREAPMIAKFKSSGRYPEGTEFERLGGSNAMWNYTCPICSQDEYVQEGLCSGVFRAKSTALSAGVKSCRCSSYFRWTTSQREYQIQRIISSNRLPFTFVRWENEQGYRSVQDYFILNCKVLGDFRKRAHNFFNGNSFGPAHWDTDKERPAHFYILSVQRDGGGFTGYGISANIKERLAQHRSNLKSAGYSYGSCEIFSGNWGETLQVEREVKVVFETTSKDIKGFRTEATLACNYSEVVAFVQRSKLIQVPTNEKTMYNIVTRRNEYETCMGYRGNEPLDARND